jgi:glycosyltransferase involved in cell wall biosynthesis
MNRNQGSVRFQPEILPESNAVGDFNHPAQRLPGKPVKVLFIHQAFVSHSDAGGSRHFELFQYCVKKNCSFTVITSRISYLTGIDKTTSFIRGSNNPISVIYAYSPSALHHSFFWRIICFIVFMLSSIYNAIKVKNVDIVMGTTPPIFQAMSAWIVAMLRRRPFILEVRDLWPEFAIDMGVLKQPILIELSRWLENFLYRRADHIIVNSPAYVGYLENKGVQAQKITLVANGVDPEMFEIK